MTEIQELNMQVAQLKSYLVTLAEHQIHDQARLASLEAKNAGLVETIGKQQAELQAIREGVDADKMMQGNMNSMLWDYTNDVSMAFHAQQDEQWVESDAKLDTALNFTVAEEMKKALMVEAEAEGVSIGAVVRQCVVKARPKLQQHAGPRSKTCNGKSKFSGVSLDDLVLLPPERV